MKTVAVISKGITLSYKQSSSGEVVLKGLQSVAELGGTVESIEITTLEDEAHVYEKGIKNYGDSLDFTFLYNDGAEFFKLQGITDKVEWSVKLPDGAKKTSYYVIKEKVKNNSKYKRSLKNIYFFYKKFFKSRHNKPHYII